MLLKIHPRYTRELVGHQKEKKLFEKSYFNNSLQHCWLLEGPAGIGKASFAYCAARSILALNKPQNNKVSLFSKIEDKKENNNLDFNYDDKNLTHNRISENTHSDLKIIEQLNSEKNSQKKEIIPVDKVREIENFFSKTAGEGGWRIAIIDSIDNLNKHGSNALLKILEEPPQKCLIFLISNNKSNVLDTIRSRSRILKFSELNHIDTKLIIQKLTITEDEEELRKINILAGGSPGKAIILFNNDGLIIYENIISIFNKIPNLDSRIIDPILKDISNPKNIFGINILNILVTVYLNRTYRRGLNLIELNISEDEKQSQDKFLQYYNIEDIPSLWEKIFTNINLSLNFNLDKKQVVINFIENINTLTENNKFIESN